MSTTYTVSVTRDGKWWMVAVPELNARRDRLEAEEAKVRADTAAFARELAAAQVPVRDIGTLLGVTFQRVSQLVNT